MNASLRGRTLTIDERPFEHPHAIRDIRVGRDRVFAIYDYMEFPSGEPAANMACVDAADGRSQTTETSVTKTPYTTPMNVISTKRLSRRYGRRVGIDDVDLEIREGRIFGFLGPNGAGKTTTIRLLLGFLRPSSGKAAVFGLDCWRDSPRIKRDVGYLPGEPRLYPWLTAKRALTIIGSVRGGAFRAGGLALADRFNLEMTLPVRNMSRGTRQKLGLLIAMAHRPRLLILDEPTSGLDPLMRGELAACLRELAAEGHTIFFSSHTLSEVEALCDRVAIVRKGRIVADETLKSLRKRAKRIVELTFADREAALRVQLPGFLTAQRRDGSRIECELDGPAPPLVEWAAGQQLSDLSIGRPDLERLFREYYEPARETPE